jgi:hypothetical protein
MAAFAETAAILCQSVAIRSHLVAAGSAASSSNSVPSGVAAAVLVMLLLGALFRWALVPMARGAIHLLEGFVDVAIKLGVGVLALGAVGAVVVATYVVLWMGTALVR